VREGEFVRSDPHDVAVARVKREHVEGEGPAACTVEVGNSGYGV
jgi:hypothetical protein